MTRGRATRAIGGLCAALFLLAASAAESTAASRTNDFPRQEPFVVRPFRPYLGERWIGAGVAYGPHRDGQRPGGPAPTRAQLRADLRLIARRWHLIRLYDSSTTGRSILRVIRAERLPLRVFLGVWVGAEDRRDSTGQRIDPAATVAAANRREIDAAVLACRDYPDLVVALCAGNETQIEWSSQRVPSARLIATVRELRARTRVPVTTADDLNYWNKPASRALAGELDFVATHLHPLWNGSSLDSALAWVTRNLEQVRAVHPDRAVIIGETGWATRRNDAGDQGKLMKGALGEAEQAAYYRGLMAWVNAARVPTFFFEAFDENWKGGTDPSDVEKHWGLFRADRTPKSAIAGSD